MSREDGVVRAEPDSGRACFERMKTSVTALERAFDLTRSGRVADVEEIRKRLRVEGYDQTIIQGGSLIANQLRDIITAASRRPSNPGGRH